MFKTKKILKNLADPNEFSKKTCYNNEWARYITAYLLAPYNFFNERETSLANYEALYQPVWKICILIYLNIWVKIHVSFNSPSFK